MNDKIRPLSSLARVGALVAFFSIAITAADARTIYVTPNGETGYDAAGGEHAAGHQDDSSPRSYTASSFRDVQPGDVIQLLATTRDPNGTTIFAGRMELKDVKAFAAPVIIQGLGRRTRVTSQSLESLRCPMPKTNVEGCEPTTTSDRLAMMLSSNRGALRPRREDLLDAILDAREPQVTFDVRESRRLATPEAINPHQSLKIQLRHF